MSPRSRPFHAWVGLFVTCGVAAAVYGWIASGATVVGWYSDSIDYLVLSDFYRASYSGRAIEQAAEAFRTSRFPPLYPVMLALSGAGTDAIQAAFFATALMGVLAAAATWWWVRSDGATVTTATLLGLTTVLTPESLLWMLYPVSEPLMAALLCAVLALSTRPGWRSGTRLNLLALLSGIVPLARLAALPLPVAFVLWAWRSGIRGRSVLAPTALALLPSVAWLIYRGSLPAAESYFDSLAPESVEQGIPGGWTWLATQPLRMFDALGMLWHPPAEWLRVVAFVVLLLVAIGTWTRWRRRRLDAIVLPAALGLLCVWPYPAESVRLLVPLVPLLLVAAADGAGALAARIGRRADTARNVAVVALLALAAPMLGQFVARAAEPVEAALEPFKRNRSYFEVGSPSWAAKSLEVRARIHAAVLEIGRIVPRDECVWAHTPSAVWLYGHRTTFSYPDVTGLQGNDLRAALGRCRWFFVAYQSSAQMREPFLHPLPQLETIAEPVFASSFRFRGGRHLAAALLVAE